MDKEFQLNILRTSAKLYPEPATSLWEELVSAAPGETEAEKSRALIAHLHALQEQGFIEGFRLRVSVDGHMSCGHSFSLTTQGLRAAGETLVCSERDERLREMLLEQIQAARTLSPQEKTSVKSVLSSLPRVALERLRDKGLDALLGFLFP